VVSDITERKQSAQAIRELNATLERKVEEREATFRAGVNVFMAKPMKIKDVKAVLKPCLKAVSEE